MKHTWKITLILVAIFFFTQIFGLFTVAKYVEPDIVRVGDVVNGTPSNVSYISYSSTVAGEAPDVEPSTGLIYIIIAVAFATFVLLLLMRKRMHKVWKTWFFLAIFMTSSVTLGVYAANYITVNSQYYLALPIAFLLGLWKILKPNTIIHNLTEVLMYTGIAVIFVPIFKESILWAAILLIVISIYDMIAVWQSKHMVKLAEFTMESKLFAGVYIPYTKAKNGIDAKLNTVRSKIKKSNNNKSRKSPQFTSIKSSKSTKSVTSVRKGSKNAILGGGDIAFPLMFAGVVMTSLAKSSALYTSLLIAAIISVTTAIALFLLFTFAKKDRYYPAMPFISAGCFIGYLIVWLIF